MKAAEGPSPVLWLLTSPFTLADTMVLDDDPAPFATAPTMPSFHAPSQPQRGFRIDDLHPAKPR